MAGNPIEYLEEVKKNNPIGIRFLIEVEVKNDESNSEEKTRENVENTTTSDDEKSENQNENDRVSSYYNSTLHHIYIHGTAIRQFYLRGSAGILCKVR